MKWEVSLAPDDARRVGVPIPEGCELPAVFTVEVDDAKLRDLLRLAATNKTGKVVREDGLLVVRRGRR